MILLYCISIVLIVSLEGVYVAGLSMHVCHNVTGCADLMKKGFNNRHVGATLMNKVPLISHSFQLDHFEDSSRSHSIFTVYVEAMNEEGNIRMGKLNLVDLAGSERQSKTGENEEKGK